jgi:hypothetical protein
MVDPMNNFISKVSILSTMFFAAAGNADSLSPRSSVEVPLERVFVPRVGFDDNDNVQAVVAGTLPNACYSLGNTDFAIVAGSKKILISQNAVRDESGVCADEANLPPAFKQGIPFWREIDFGLLPNGTHRLIYSTLNGVSSRDFTVEVAPTGNVDSLRYAIVTNAFVQDVVSSTQNEIEIRVTGYLTSSCARLGPESRVEKVDDVYIFLPAVSFTEDLCLPSNRPFYKEVRVPTPAAGHYLLHIRSQAGQSRNKPFVVTAD